jgi:hypothetical protein
MDDVREQVRLTLEARLASLEQRASDLVKSA